LIVKKIRHAPQLVLMISQAVASIRAEGWTMRKTESDPKGPREFIFFAMELLPDELFPVSIVIGVVFGLIWLLGAVFRSFLGE
jgi:hypothetical protein